MSPLNRGPLLGPRMPPIGMRPPLPRFGGRLPMPGMPPRMPPPPMGPMFGPMRQRMMPPRPGPMMRPGGGPPPPLFGPRGRGVPPLMPPMMGPRVMGPRGPLMRPGPRGLLPPQGLPHMRPRFPMGNGNIKTKAMNNAKKVSKLEELELKKPWMTDEIRNEIQKKNKLYAKAKKNKDAKEWDEFKDLRNKVTRMIRDAKNEYLAKNPEQANNYEDEDDEPYDWRDENYTSAEDDDTSYYCEVCDREFETFELLKRHNETHKICGIDGCMFSAHPKLVEKHISMQHCTGLYHRLKNLSTPEDIEKWIFERKKKYPTKLNVERSRAEKLEKMERGEIIEKQQRKVRESRKNVGEKKRKIRNRKTRDCKVKIEEPITQLYRGLLPFAGTANLPKIVDDIDNENEDDEQTEFVEKIKDVEEIEFLTVTCNISDDEDERNPLQCNELPLQLSEEPLKLTEVPPKQEIQSGLASLMANYGSDSEDDDAPEEIPIKKLKTEIPPATETSQGPKESIPEPVTKDRQIQDVPKVIVKCRDRRKNSRTTRNRKNPSTKEKSNHSRSNVDDNQNSTKRLMLLQRLLSRSIQHERNLICQCIKYIADNNFFDD